MIAGTGIQGQLIRRATYGVYVVRQSFDRHALQISNGVGSMPFVAKFESAGTVWLLFYFTLAAARTRVNSRQLSHRIPIAPTLAAMFTSPLTSSTFSPR